MPSTDLLLDSFGRINDLVHEVLDGAEPGMLTYRIDAAANTVGWLVWHLTRIQDDHLADAAGTAQVWIRDGWAEKFDLPFDVAATGYGQHPDDVAAITSPAELLAGYHDAVHRRTLAFVRSLAEPDLARVVDDRWDPPVTLAVRLVSVEGDALQHLGQAAYIRGVAERAGRR
jgi:hypothetical protein